MSSGFLGRVTLVHLTLACLLVSIACRSTCTALRAAMGWPLQVPNEDALDNLVMRLMSVRAPKVA